MNGHVVAVGDIEIGRHITWDVVGLTLNVDTILGTLIAGAILIGLGFWVRRGATSGVPKRGQLVFETVTDTVEKQVESTLGIRTAPFVVPLAITLFFFILIANWLALIPTGHHPEYVPPPASDVNLAYALALLVIVWMHVDRRTQKGCPGLLPAPRAAVLVAVPDQPDRGDRPADHAVAATLRQHLLRRDHGFVDRALFPAYILWAPISFGSPSTCSSA